MTKWPSVIVRQRSRLGSFAADNPEPGNNKHWVFKLCVPPGDVRRGPNEGTATAQAHPPLRAGTRWRLPGWLQHRNGEPAKRSDAGSPRPRAAPGSSL